MRLNAAAICDRAREYRADGGEMLALVAGGRLIGFGGLKKKDARRVELCNLHLHPDRHGQGLGKFLTQALMRRAAEFGYLLIELHVTASQHAAVGLYKHLGFTQTGRQTYTVGTREFDTIFMEYQVRKD